MKKAILICCIVTIIVQLLAVPAFANEAPTVVVGSAAGEVGTSVEIPVVLSNNTGFSSLGIEIGYDNTALTLTNVTQGVGIGATFTHAQEMTANPYNMSWDSASNTVFNGTIVTLTFEIKATQNGEYPISVDFYKGRNGNYIDGDSVNYDENFDALNLSYISGKISVSGNVGEVRPTVTVGNAIGKVGEDVNVSVLLENNTGFSSLGIEIGYDNTALTLTNVTQGVGIGANFTTAQNLAVNPYNMSWDSASNTLFNGTLVTLTFKVLNSGTYTISVDFYKGRNGNYIDGDSVNYDENFNALNLAYVGGIITANQASGISFDVEFEGDSFEGVVYAALCDENGFVKATKQYSPSSVVHISFDEDEFAGVVKVMWWDDKMQPMSDVKIIPISK